MKTRAIRLFFWVFLALAGIGTILLQSSSIQAQDVPASGSNPVYLLTLNDQIITPISAEYIEHGIDEAKNHHAEAVVIELDTPGGMLSATHTIVKDILNAPVPVIVYVGPAGARAASAGVFITLSANIAAMEPTTHIGAAHPVDENGNWPMSPDQENPQQQNQAQPPDLKKANSGDVMSEKILNDTVAYIKGIAHARNRNEDWAVHAVRQSVSITADEALKNHVVDILAPDLHTLLADIDGKTVTVNGNPVVLHTARAEVHPYEFSLRQQLLSLLANPLLAYILLMVAFYGIIFEVTHPGIQISGVLGLMALILALLGMQALSINMAGLGLILLGLVLFIVEIFTSTFGILLFAGIVCLMLGTVMIYQSGDPYLRQSMPYAIGIGAVAVTFLGMLLWKVYKMQRRKPADPVKKLVGELGRVTLTIPKGSSGKVRVFGEVWDAIAADGDALPENTSIRVTGFVPDNPRVLTVARKNPEST